MLKTLKILTIILAVFLIVMKTTSVSVTGDSVFTLLPMYLIAGWLLSFLIFKKKAPKILLSGWGVLLGFSYFALIEKVPDLPPRPVFVDMLFGVITLISAAGILFANYSIIASQDEHFKQTEYPVKVLKIIVYLLAGLLILVGIFSFGPLRTKISYFVLGAIMVVLCFFLKSEPKIPFIGFCVAFGFLGSDLTGLLRFFDPPVHVLAFTVITTVVSLLGLVLAFSYTSFKFRLSRNKGPQYTSS